jgi:tetratricopeptide (TPR) repeat protein
MTLRRALSLIRLSEYDPELFFLLFPFFMSTLDIVQLTLDLKKDLVQMVTSLWSNAAYHLDSRCDFAYDLGRMYHKLDETKLARSLYQVSISKHYKKRALASFQLAKSIYLENKNLVKTLAFLDQAIQFNPNFIQAFEWHRQIQQELQTICQEIQKIKMKDMDISYHNYCINFTNHTNLLY